MQEDPDYARRKYQEGKEKLVDQINERLRSLMKIARSNRDTKIHESGQMSQHALEVTYITVGLAIIISILISFYNTRRIEIGRFYFYRNEPKTSPRENLKRYAIFHHRLKSKNWLTILISCARG